uniref:G-protein coupled receptors family 2 profile 1 domain-containing protein n=1 Tax=Nothobranchius furzeri TaxID=105023 RepID=A0A8C6LWN0_NOTFU
MDATIYEIIVGELGDLNCSLIEQFNDSFWENASLSLLSSDGLYCNATTDEIGTCWPRSSTGRIVERPCPAYINGVKYNTTSKMLQSLQKVHNTRFFIANLIKSLILVIKNT